MRVEAVMELMFLSSSSWKILRTSEAQLPATPNYICHILCRHRSGYFACYRPVTEKSACSLRMCFLSDPTSDGHSCVVSR